MAEFIRSKHTHIMPLPTMMSCGARALLKIIRSKADVNLVINDLAK